LQASYAARVSLIGILTGGERGAHALLECATGNQLAGSARIGVAADRRLQPSTLGRFALLYVVG
jgi:hypothetical protein